MLGYVILSELTSTFFTVVCHQNADKVKACCNTGEFVMWPCLFSGGGNECVCQVSLSEAIWGINYFLGVFSWAAMWNWWALWDLNFRSVGHDAAVDAVNQPMMGTTSFACASLGEGQNNLQSLHLNVRLTANMNHCSGYICNAIWK